MILPQTKLGPHRQHFFQLENVEGKVYTHVKLTIYPDGGLQRIRILGHRVSGKKTAADDESAPTPVLSSPMPETQPVSSATRLIPVLPLTPEAFAPFGQVIQAYGDHAAAPKGTKITPANGGSASKFHKLSLLESSYSSSAGATPGISVYRCQPEEINNGRLELKVLERHLFTNQAFIPMGCGNGEGLSEPAQKYLVVVAHTGPDDRPNLHTVRAFVANAAQGIVYKTAIWRESICYDLGLLLLLTLYRRPTDDGTR